MQHVRLHLLYQASTAGGIQTLSMHVNLLLWSPKFCCAQDRWKPCSSLAKCLLGMTCIQSREQERAAEQRACSLLTSIKHRLALSLTLSGPVKHGKDAEKRWAAFLGSFQTLIYIWPNLNVWPFISHPVLPDNVLSSLQPKRAAH